MLRSLSRVCVVIGTGLNLYATGHVVRRKEME